MSASAPELRLLSESELRRAGASPTNARSIVRNRDHRAWATAAVLASRKHPKLRRLARFATMFLAAPAGHRTALIRYVDARGGVEALGTGALGAAA